MKNNQQKRANNPSPAANINDETVVNAGIEGIAAGVEVGPGLGEAETILERATGQGGEAFSIGGTMEGPGYGTGGERADESGISEWIEDLVGGA